MGRFDIDREVNPVRVATHGLLGLARETPGASLSRVAEWEPT